jgi:hypothetical protein
MAEIQMEGLQVSAKNLRDKLGLLAITFGEILRPAIMGIIDTLRLLVDAMITVFEKKWVQWIIAITTLTASLIALNKVLKLTAALVFFKFMGKSVKELMALGTATTIATAAFHTFRDRVAFAAAQLSGMATQSAVNTLQMQRAASQAGFFSTMLTAVGVAAKKLWAILMAHKIGILLAAIATLILAFYKLKNAKLDDIKANEALATSTKQQADDYKKYADQLRKVGQGSAEFYRIQDRIMNQFPELGKELKEGETDLEGLIEKLDKIGHTKGEESLKRYTEHIKNLGDMADDNAEEMRIYMDVLDSNGKYMSLLNKRIMENEKSWYGYIPVIRHVIAETQTMFDMLKNKNKVLQDAGKEVTKRLKNERDYAKHMAIAAYEADRLNEKQNDLTSSTEFYNEALEKAIAMGPVVERNFRGQYRVLEKMEELKRKYGQDLSNLKSGFAFLFSDFPDDAREKWMGFYASVGEAGKQMLVESAMGLIEYRDKLEKFNEEVEILSAERIDALVKLERERRFKELIKDQTEYTRKAIELMERPYKVQIEAAKRSYDRRMDLLKDEMAALDKASSSYGANYVRIYRDINTTIKDFYKEQHNAAWNLYDSQVAVWQGLPDVFNDVMTEGMDAAYRKMLDTQKNAYVEEYNELKGHYSSMVSAYQSAMGEITKLNKQAAKDRAKIAKDLQKDLKKIEEDTNKDILKMKQDLIKELRRIDQDRTSILMENLSDEEKTFAVRRLLEENHQKFKQAIQDQNLEDAREYLDNIKSLEGEIIEGYVDKKPGVVDKFVKDEKAIYEQRMFWNEKIKEGTKELGEALIEERKKQGEEEKKKREAEGKDALKELDKGIGEQLALARQQAGAYKSVMDTLKADMDSLSKKIYEVQQIEIQIEISQLHTALEDITKEIEGFNSSEASKVFIEFMERGVGSQLIIETIRELRNYLDEFKTS